MVLHGVLDSVKDCKGICEGCEADDGAKALYKRGGSLHDGWAAACGPRGTYFKFQFSKTARRRQEETQHVQTL